MIFRRTILAVLLSIYALMWIGGIGSHIWFESTPEETRWAAPVFLMLAGLIVIVTSRRFDLAWLSLVLLLGFVAEAIGIRCDFLFGNYIYTSTLAPQLFGVPLVMASAWMVLVAYIRQMLTGFQLRAWVEALAAALWMTAIDLIIDPLAAGTLGYWRWNEPGAYYGIPAHNFIGWFTISLLIFIVVGVLFGRGRHVNIWARRIGLSILLFFTLIALLHELILAGLFGITLCLLHLAISVFATKASAPETNRSGNE